MGNNNSKSLRKFFLTRQTFPYKNIFRAGMVELVDAVDSKSTECILLRVQVSLPVPVLENSVIQNITAQNIKSVMIKIHNGFFV